MRGIRIVGWLVIALMSTLMVNILLHDGMGHGVGFDVFLAGAANPWQLFIDNDLVSGLLFMCVWIIFREQGGRGLDTVAWIWMVLWWGNIIVAIYVLWAVWQAQGDGPRFFMGRRAGVLRGMVVAPLLRLLAGAIAVGVVIWLGFAIAAVGRAPIAIAGYLLGFLPIALSGVRIALPARR